jgi:hypothetical protein
VARRPAVETDPGLRASDADREQRAAMLAVAVQEYIADVRPVFGERTA